MPKKAAGAPDEQDVLSFSERIATATVGADMLVQKIIPSGALVARRLTTGAVQFYWRWTTAGRVDRERIGLFDRRLPPKKLEPVDGAYSAAGAAQAAVQLAKAHAEAIVKGLGGLRGQQAAEAAADAARKAEAEQLAAQMAAAEVAHLQAEEEQRARADAELKARAECNLERLLTAYCDHLAALNRRSHQDARSIFKTHIFAPWPKLAALPAAELIDEQVADILRRIVEKGHLRTAGKCRAYMSAAYELARKSRTDPKVPIAFKAYGVRFNPASATATIDGSRGADKNPLSLEQTRIYWRAIKDIDTPLGAMLRLHLLTGGQRIEQLVRLKTADIGNEMILIYDGKGRPGRAPRHHHLPLLPEARKALDRIAPKGAWALSTDGGKTHVAATTLSQAAKDAGKAVEGFATKRLRSGVETLLASAGVSRDTRGRLQSHGISGVQATHYDGHDYLSEKLLALQTLLRLLETNVVPIRSAA